MTVSWPGFPGTSHVLSKFSIYLVVKGLSQGQCSPQMALYANAMSELPDISAQISKNVYRKGHKVELFSEKMTSGNSKAADLLEVRGTLAKTMYSFSGLYFLALNNDVGLGKLGTSFILSRRKS